MPNSIAPRILRTLFVALPFPLLAQRPTPTVSLKRDPVVIPLDRTAVRPTITTNLGGKGPYKLTLDTGAGGSVIDSSLARELSFEVVGRSRVASPGGAPSEVDVVNPGTLAIGDVEIANVYMTAFPFRAHALQLDAVISYRAFASVVMSIDLAQSSLTLSNKGLVKDAPGVLSYELSRGLIQIPVAIGSRNLALDLDTGSPGELTLPRALMDSLPLKAPAVPGPDAHLASDTRKTWTARLAGSVRVAGIEVKEPDVTFIDLDRGNVGCGFIRRFVMTIDQAQHLIAFAPIARDTVGRAQATRIVDSLAQMMRARYVDPDTGAMIAGKLAAALQAGTYDTATTLRGLASALTQTLRSVNGDRHLGVRVPPSGAPSQPIGPSLGGVTAISGTAILPGNVGYVAFKQIPVPTPEVLDALASTMKTLAPADALIIDVRDDGGGAGNFNDFVWGYLTPGSDSVLTMRAQPRGGPVFDRWTKVVTGPRPRANVPVFVLVNGRTGSAAEGLAFYLQQSGRARVIGERTAGAGHNVAIFPLSDSLQAVISIGRVWYPANKKEWERTGVVPNDSVASASALCFAHGAALKAIGAAKKAVDPAARLKDC